MEVPAQSPHCYVKSLPWVEDEGCEEEDADLPESQDLSERDLEVEERADEAISTSSRVRGTLALGVICQSACLPLHKREA